MKHHSDRSTAQPEAKPQDPGGGDIKSLVTPGDDSETNDGPGVETPGPQGREGDEGGPSNSLPGASGSIAGLAG